SRSCSGRTAGPSTRGTVRRSRVAVVPEGASADGGVPAVCRARVVGWAGAAGGVRGGRDRNPRVVLPAGDPVPASPLRDAVCHGGAAEWGALRASHLDQFADSWEVTILGVAPPT